MFWYGPPIELEPRPVPVGAAGIDGLIELELMPVPLVAGRPVEPRLVFVPGVGAGGENALELDGLPKPGVVPGAGVF
jgi:hypothetical protein